MVHLYLELLTNFNLDIFYFNINFVQFSSELMDVCPVLKKKY